MDTSSKTKIVSLAAGIALLSMAKLSYAIPIVCGENNTESAMANGAYADDCNYEPSSVSSSADLLMHTNDLWGGEDAFTYIGKYENGTGSEAGDMAGFTLTVFEGDDEFKYGYQLTVSDAWNGKTVDWVLGVKQGSNSYMSYLFEDVTLGIEGGYNNFWISGGGKEVNDYSFIAGFIREVTVRVPEPGTLSLLTAGLLGLYISRRRIRKFAE